MTLSEALKYRKALDSVIDELGDEAAEAVKVLYQQWAIGVDYVVGDKRNYI